MEINTYDKFNNLIDSWIQNNIQFCIIRGNGGDGKTYTVNERLQQSHRENYIIFSGHVTPLSMYNRLRKNPNALVVFDDVDTLLNNQTIVALMKQICEVEEEKPVRYASTTHLLDEDEKEFMSRNKVLILCNDLSLFSNNLKALKTRALVVEFQPFNSEILDIMRNSIAQTEKHQKIVDFIEEHVAPDYSLNFRMLTKTMQLLNTPINWKNYLCDEFGINNKKLIVESIINAYDSGEITKEEAKSRYMDKTGNTERSFYRDIKKYINKDNYISNR